LSAILFLRTRRGIPIEGGLYLEGARKLKFVGLDKTGTVTKRSYGLSEYLGRRSFL